jgi:hypothetical protein
MASSTALIAIVVMAVGGYVGWHMRQAYGLHSDIKTYKSRIPKFRAQRNRSGLISIVTVVIALFLVYALLRLCAGARWRGPGSGGPGSGGPRGARWRRPFSSRAVWTAGT